MKLLKLASALVAIALLACPFVGCDEEDNSTGTNSGANGAYDPNSPSDSVQPSVGGEVYEKYKNLVRIEEFVNDRAAFVVFEDDGSTHWGGGEPTYTGSYTYGYIDVKGNVVIEPKYMCSPRYSSASAFQFNYTKVSDDGKKDYIIDRDGNVKFETGKNGVNQIGKAENGYFWIEMVEEKVSGNEYSVKYYSAQDMKEIATIDNVTAVSDNALWTELYSTINAEGKAIVEREDGTDVDINITKYDSSFKPEKIELSFDLDKIGVYTNSYAAYDLSTANNELGQIAAVTLMNEQGEKFYSTIDSQGNVLMKPQNDIAFFKTSSPGGLQGNSNFSYAFCKNLCPALDRQTGLWGYIDPYGNWVIKAQYRYARPFSKDGYAIVDSSVIINTSGKVVLAPDGWSNENYTTLNGTYTHATDSSLMMIFFNDGTMVLDKSYSKRECTYQLNGGIIVFPDMGYSASGIFEEKTEYVICEMMSSGSLWINGYLWEKAK